MRLQRTQFQHPGFTGRNWESLGGCLSRLVFLACRTLHEGFFWRWCSRGKRHRVQVAIIGNNQQVRIQNSCVKAAHRRRDFSSPITFTSRDTQQICHNPGTHGWTGLPCTCRRQRGWVRWVPGDISLVSVLLSCFRLRIENVEVMNPGTLLWTAGGEDEIMSLDQVPPGLPAATSQGRSKYIQIPVHPLDTYPRYWL